MVAAVQGTLGGLMFLWLGLPTPLLWGSAMGSWFSSGQPLTVNPLGLLGKSEPSDLYFFICPFHRGVSGFRRILLGLGRSLSVNVRTPRHTGRTLESGLGSSITEP